VRRFSEGCHYAMWGKNGDFGTFWKSQITWKPMQNKPRKPFRIPVYTVQSLVLRNSSETSVA